MSGSGKYCFSVSQIDLENQPQGHRIQPDSRVPVRLRRRNGPMRHTIAQTIHWLQNSPEALFTQRSVAGIITGLRTIQEQFEQTGSIDITQLSLLFASTGPIQEFAIDNGWGAEFLLLAAEVDKII